VNDGRNSEQSPDDPRRRVSYAPLLFAAKPIVTPVNQSERRTFEKDRRKEGGDVDPSPPEQGVCHPFASERVCHCSGDDDTDDHHNPSDYAPADSFTLSGVLRDLVHLTLIMIQIVHFGFPFKR
jgi:hypothetical protein